MKDKIEKEVRKLQQEAKMRKREMEVEKNMIESLFLIVFSSTVCDVILQKQKDKHVNDIHQLPCLKRKLVDEGLSCFFLRLLNMA